MFCIKSLASCEPGDVCYTRHDSSRRSCRGDYPMNLNLDSLIPSRVAARLEEGNFGFADPLLGANGPPIPSALEVRDLIEDFREMLFPGLTDGRSRKSAQGRVEIE